MTTSPGGADLARVVAIVPVRGLEAAKSRLGEPLDPEERLDLVVRLVRQTVESAVAAPRVEAVLVVSEDPGARELAASLGARAVRQRPGDLNDALDQAREVAVEAGATAVVVLPADLPAIEAGAVDALVQAAADGALGGSSPPRAVVVLVGDRHGTGTNALLISPPGAIPFAFGPGTLAAHRAAAVEAGAVLVEPGGALELDLDTADDLLDADDLRAPDPIGAPDA